MKIYKIYKTKVRKYISNLESIKYKEYIIYKVKTPLWWRTRLYKPHTVLKKNKNE